MKLFMVLLMTAFALACGGPSPEGGSTAATEDSLSTLELSRADIVGRLQAAGLAPTVKDDYKLSKSQQKALPETPLERFIFFVDREGVMPIRFSSHARAEQMANNYGQDKGFVVGSWYMLGLITVDTRARIQAALAASTG